VVFTSQVQVSHVRLQYIVGVAEHQKHGDDYYFLMTFCHQIYSEAEVHKLEYQPLSKFEHDLSADLRC
jgi:hypothetical protein